MVHDLIGFENFTLKGDTLSRAIAALRVARNQVRIAIAETESWRVEAALSEIEDDLSVDLRRIEGAADDDAAEISQIGEASARLQARLPLKAA